MGLNIRLLHGEKCVINGAVISCKSPRTTISVENYAHVIRGADILDPDNVKTPTQHVYFVIQLMLIDAENFERHKLHYNTVMGQLRYALENTEVLEALAHTDRLVENGDFYAALRELKSVLAYEERLLGEAPAPRPLVEAHP
jgi:flagellar protein FlbT